VAYEFEEHTLGIAALGVSLADPATGNSYAISVPVPTQRFNDCQAELIEQLLLAKQALGAQVAPASLTR
jgi:DNA-binding IclR family transcriptional regulator